MSSVNISGQEYSGLKSGDLIFVKEGSSDFSKAITESTAYEDSVKFIHVGIIEITPESEYMIIEASPEEGVRIISLDKFLQQTQKKGDHKGVVIKRLNIDFPIAETLEKAKSYLGEPYDWWYLPDNGKMYCSELVYEAYRYENGERIFHSFPMNFRAPDGTMPEFWVKLYEQLGERVPEGVLGTNPNALSKEDVLIEISF